MTLFLKAIYVVCSDVVIQKVDAHWLQDFFSQLKVGTVYAHMLLMAMLQWSFPDMVANGQLKQYTYCLYVRRSFIRLCTGSDHMPELVFNKLSPKRG